MDSRCTRRHARERIRQHDEAKRRATGLLVVTAFELPDVWSITYGLPVSCSVDEIRDNVLQNTRRVHSQTTEMAGAPAAIL
jgi:hypothetical protein